MIVGVPAAVTAVLFLPQLVTNPSDFSPILSVVWLVLLLSAAPVVVAILSYQRRPIVGARQLLLLGLSQFALVLCLVRLDTWLEVRRGYLLAGSGEEAMSYGIGFVVSIVGGSVLASLVAAGAYAGATRAGRDPDGTSGATDG